MTRKLLINWSGRSEKIVIQTLVNIMTGRKQYYFHYSKKY